MTDAPRIDITASPEEAIAWAESRGVELPADYYGALTAEARRASFTVTGLAQLAQLQGVLDSLTEATAKGQTLRDWRKTIDHDVGRLPAHRQELIFRNAVQTNYGAGREEQQARNASSRPILMWDAINDSRTRTSHRVMDGFMAPIESPVWRVWRCPAGHNCRCSRIALTQAQAERRGYRVGMAPPDAAVPDSAWFGDPASPGRLESLLNEKAAAADRRVAAAVLGW
jgi:SPP1 gp7 family putative phage head morphogenesis protein